MSKDHDDKLNPDGLDFTLAEILAEYAVKENQEPEGSIPIPMEPEAATAPPPAPIAKVLHFPGASPPSKSAQKGAEEPPTAESTPSADPEEAESPPVPHTARRLRGGGKRLLHPSEPEPEPPPPPQPPKAPPKTPPKKQPEAERKGGKHLPPNPPPEKVVPFPKREKGLMAKLRGLQAKADGFAEHMFEEEGKEDSPEVREAEQYIPGVDLEEPEEVRPPRRKRRPPPPAPDLPPQELFRRYSRGLMVLKLRTVLVFLLAGVLLFLTLGPTFGGPLPDLLAQSRSLLLYCQAGLLLLAMLLGLDAVLWGLFRLVTLRLGMDSLVVLSCAAALADALTLMRFPSAPERQPYCAIAALALAFTMQGNYLKQD